MNECKFSFPPDQSIQLPHVQFVVLEQLPAEGLVQLGQFSQVTQEDDLCARRHTIVASCICITLNTDILMPFNGGDGVTFAVDTMRNGSTTCSKAGCIALPSRRHMLAAMARARAPSCTCAMQCT